MPTLRPFDLFARSVPSERFSAHSDSAPIYTRIRLLVQVDSDSYDIAAGHDVRDLSHAKPIAPLLARWRCLHVENEPPSIANDVVSLFLSRF